MSFAPVLGPGSLSHAYIRSSASACFASLATLCSSWLAMVIALVDNLATRIPPARCPVCWWKGWSRKSTENESTENRPAEDKTTAVVFDPGTGFCTLKRLEDIDGKYCAAFPIHMLGRIAHCTRSRESHLPRFPSRLSAIYQSPACGRNEAPCRSHRGCVLEKGIEASALAR